MLAGLFLAALVLPRPRATIRGINRAVAALARRRRAAILSVIVFVLVGRAALLPKFPIPKPAIADEFGYLLTADTFAHGRLTNPTPPLWKHFETFHVFFVPTYQSQYPIGYPVLLCVAQIITGEPWWAVYLTTALLCGAIVWMLQGWVPPYWAFVGGILTALRFGLFTYWMNSFWGGSLAALGGCLVFGALPRILPGVGRARINRQHTTRNATWIALGFALLITTRPYEGFIVSVPATILFLATVFKNSRTERLGRLWRAVVPVVVTIALLFSFLAYYQFKVTGHATESPYEVASRQYHVSRPFIFQDPLPAPKYNHLELRYIYVHFEAMGADRMRYFWGFLDALKDRAEWYWQFFSGPVFTLPYVASLLSMRRKRLRLVWITLALLTAGVLIESWIQVHYLAPAFCLFALLLIEGIRTVRLWRIRSFHVGLRLVYAGAVVFVTMVALRVFALPADSYEGAAHWPPNWAYSTFQLARRDQIEGFLQEQPGKHLVLVRYRASFHSPHEEYVYNGADLKNTKILWARSMDVANNCEIAKAYRGERELWLVDNWGSIAPLRSESESQICDPSNMIYQRNRPPEYYEHSVSAPH
jgi:hypothetical protein